MAPECFACPEGDRLRWTDRLDIICLGRCSCTNQVSSVSVSVLCRQRMNISPVTQKKKKKKKRNRAEHTLKMSQHRLASELVDKYGLKEAKTKSIPMSPSIRITQTQEDKILDKEVYRYSELVGSLLYLSVCTRPDTAQAVGVLARHMATPSMDHWTAAEAVLRYIAGTLDLGITFRQTSTAVEGYCDADFAGCWI